MNGHKTPRKQPKPQQSSCHGQWQMTQRKIYTNNKKTPINLPIVKTPIKHRMTREKHG